MLDTLLTDERVINRLPESIKSASRSGDLHTVILNKLASEGQFEPAFSPEVALRNLGKNIFLKNAQWALVRRGLDALKEL